MFRSEVTDFRIALETKKKIISEMKTKLEEYKGQ